MESIDQLDDGTIVGLRSLAIMLRDSQVGLTDASSKISDASVVELFYRLAADRAEMEQQLNEVLHGNDVPLPDDTSLVGELRNVWTRVRAILSGDNVEVILAEVERSESMLVTQYKKILPRIAGNAINDVLLGQFESLASGLTAIVETKGAINSR